MTAFSRAGAVLHRARRNREVVPGACFPGPPDVAHVWLPIDEMALRAAAAEGVYVAAEVKS